MCFEGASPAENQISASQTSLFNTLSTQATKIFGASSSTFNTLSAAYSPIVSAGPNQPGFSAPEKAVLDTQAIDATAGAYSSARQSIGEQTAAYGGGNVALPGGASIGPQATLSAAAANTESNELNTINIDDYQTGRQNWLAAANGLAGAPSVFNPATGAGEAATTAGKTAFGEADTIYQENLAAQNAELATIGEGVGLVADAATAGLSGGATAAFGGMSPGAISSSFGGPSSAETDSSGSTSGFIPSV